jgi:hypothetical protein
VVSISVFALTIAGLLVGFFGPARSAFISPGAVSRQHSGDEFARDMRQAAIAGDNCAGCHGAARHGPRGWLSEASMATPGPLELRKLASVQRTNMTTIDQACQRCHTRHNSHHPNVLKAFSCSACHQEHVGSGPMPATDSANCVECHGDAQTMEASFRKAPTPEGGPQQAIRSFADDHPDFAVHVRKRKDANTLKFNHERHFRNDIPMVAGKKLDCVFCHKPDATGIHHLPVSYETNCKQCHALQFDASAPDLLLPHGEPASVRAFLRSLPTQYADLGRKTRGITDEEKLKDFVLKQLSQMREQALAGDNFEQQVFFSADREAPTQNVAGLGEQGRVKFPGCAKCHEVKKVPEAAPSVTRPVLPARWLVESRFHHAKHSDIACAQCHAVTRSQATADILLPHKETCVACHSPKGGVVDACIACHTYHASRVETSP